jgi:hypothetical protein
MRHLTRQVDRQPVIDARRGENGAGLEAGRNEPVVDEVQTQNLVGPASRRGVIAAANLEIRRDMFGTSSWSCAAPSPVAASSSITAGSAL